MADHAGPAPNGLGAPDERETLTAVLEVLRRRWLLIAGVVLACIVAAVVRYETQTASYEATASVTFGTASLTESALDVNRGSGDPERDAATQVLIASSRDVAEGVRGQLRSPASPETLMSAVDVEAAPNANVVEITGSTDNAVFSARLANAFADQYIATERSNQLAAIDAAQADLRTQAEPLAAGSAERVTLEQSIARLDQLRAVAGGSVQIISRASPPTSPSGLGLQTTFMLGLLVGLALAAVLVFLLESLDRRVNSVDGFERAYRLPVLTSVPQSSFKRARAAERGRALEPYRILRSALDFVAVTRELDTLLVTSATNGEGKTTVAIDLAQAIALARRRVVLVELDLRQPTFAQQFGIEPRRGITTVLTGHDDLQDVLMQPLPRLPELSVLPAGPLPHNPSELLSSPAVSELLAELAADDTTVIIDAPPLNPVADAQVLLSAPAVHAALLVARLGSTTRDQVHRARSILDRHMLQPVGLVVTGVRDTARSGYDAYEPSRDAAHATGEPAAWQARARWRRTAD